jgi:hypothetical protein
VPVAATTLGAIVGLACNNERRAPAGVRTWTDGSLSLPHVVELFLDSPAMVGGAHRQSITCLDGSPTLAPELHHTIVATRGLTHVAMDTFPLVAATIHHHARRPPKPVALKLEASRLNPTFPRVSAPDNT